MERKRLTYQHVLLLRRALDQFAETPNLSEEEFQEAIWLAIELKYALSVELVQSE